MHALSAHQLASQHSGFAAAIAARAARRMPIHVDRADIQGAAQLGLIQAAERFRDRPGVAFTTFAHSRIQGAVLDLFRQETASRPPASHVCQRRGSSTEPALLLEEIVPSPDQSPEALCLLRETQQAIERAMSILPPRLAEVLRMRYFEECSIEAVGQRLGISKSRACRLHARALSLLGQQLNAFAPAR